MNKPRPLIHCAVQEHVNGMFAQETRPAFLFLHPDDVQDLIEYAGGNAWPRCCGITVKLAPWLPRGCVLSPLTAQEAYTPPMPEWCDPVGPDEGEEE